MELAAFPVLFGDKDMEGWFKHLLRMLTARIMQIPVPKNKEDDDNLFDNPAPFIGTTTRKLKLEPGATNLYFFLIDQLFPSGQRSLSCLLRFIIVNSHDRYGSSHQGLQHRERATPAGRKNHVRASQAQREEMQGAERAAVGQNPSMRIVY